MSGVRGSRKVIESIKEFDFDLRALLISQQSR